VLKESIVVDGTRQVNAAKGETTIVLVVEGREITIVLLADERRNGLRVQLPSGLLIGEERQHGTNGELRERVRFPGEDACIRTSDSEAGWQNAHSHRETSEQYVVREGRICFVELDEGGVLHGRIYEAGETFTTTPGRAHNLYVFKGAVFLTTKFGGAIKDWDASPELDALTKPLTEAEILGRFPTP
jgi:mannose-6-phosphate isomerase-like protein (cupin superfamily)